MIWSAIVLCFGTATLFMVICRCAAVTPHTLRNSLQTIVAYVPIGGWVSWRCLEVFLGISHEPIDALGIVAVAVHLFAVSHLWDDEVACYRRMVSQRDRLRSTRG